MADNVLGSIQVELTAKTSTFATEMDKAAAKAKSSAREIKSAIQKETTEATHSLALMGEEVGIHIPRHIRTFIAQMPGVGKAMSAAFNAVAIIAVIGVLYEAGKKVHELTESYRAMGEAAKKSNEAWGNLERPLDISNKKLELTAIKLENANAKLEHKPQNFLAEAAAEAAVKMQELSEKIIKATDDAKNLFKTEQKGAFLQLIQHTGGNKQAQDIASYVREQAAEGKDATKEGWNRAQTEIQKNLDANNPNIHHDAQHPYTGINPAEANKALYHLQNIFSAEEHGKVLTERVDTDTDKHNRLESGKEGAERAASVKRIEDEALAMSHERLVAAQQLLAVAGLDIAARERQIALNHANLEIEKEGQRIAAARHMSTEEVARAGGYSRLVPDGQRAILQNEATSTEDTKQQDKLAVLMSDSKRNTDLNTSQMLRLTQAMSISYFEVRRENALIAAENELLAKGINPTTHPEDAKKLQAEILKREDNSSQVKAIQIFTQDATARENRFDSSVAALSGSFTEMVRKFDETLDAIKPGLARNPDVAASLIPEERAKVVGARNSLLDQLANKAKTEAGHRINDPVNRLRELTGQRNVLTGVPAIGGSPAIPGIIEAEQVELRKWKAKRDQLSADVDKLENEPTEYRPDGVFTKSGVNVMARLDAIKSAPKWETYANNPQYKGNDPKAYEAFQNDTKQYKSRLSKLDAPTFEAYNKASSLAVVEAVIGVFKTHSPKDVNTSVSGIDAEIQAIQDKQLMATRTASAGMTVFFDEFTREASDSATTVKETLSTAITSVNSALVQGMMGKNSSKNWSKAFNQTGEKMIGGGLKAAEGGIMKALGLGGKRGDSAAKPLYVTEVKSLAKGAGELGTSLLKKLGSIFGFASGGQPDPYGTSIVGENGPELFTPHGVSGTITPNNKLKSMVGGSDGFHPTYNIDATGTNAAEVDMRVKTGMRQAYARATSDSQTIQHERNRRRPSSSGRY